jgi:hypothetical protein
VGSLFSFHFACLGCHVQVADPVLLACQWHGNPKLCGDDHPSQTLASESMQDVERLKCERRSEFRKEMSERSSSIWFDTDQLVGILMLHPGQMSVSCPSVLIIHIFKDLGNTRIARSCEVRFMLEANRDIMAFSRISNSVLKIWCKPMILCAMIHMSSSFTATLPARAVRGAGVYSVESYGGVRGLVAIGQEQKNARLKRIVKGETHALH